MRRALIAVLVLLAACGGGGGDTKQASSSTSTTRADVAAGASTTAPAGVEESTTTVPASTGGSTTTVAPSASAAAPTRTGPAPLAPGTYRYKQSGSMTAGAQRYDAPPEGTMVVKPVDGAGSQVLQRYLDPKGDPSDLIMQFRDDGMFLLETVVRQGGQEVRCTFEPGVATPPWPPKVGATAKGHATCGSFDLTVDSTSAITGTRPVTVDGASYTAYVIESTIKTSGQLTSETKQVDWFVAELRLSTHVESKSTGTFGTFQYSSDGVSDLVSAKPE